jgi:hypothetical protein
MVLQALYQGSLSEMLNFIEDGLADRVIAKNQGSKKARSRQISLKTGGYSQARSRLEELLVLDTVEELAKWAYERYAGKHKISAVVLDGTLLTLNKTSDIENIYVAHRNNHGACLPQMRVVFATDVYSGTATSPSFGSKKLSEQRLSYNVIDQLAPDTIVIADRNFGVFSVVSRIAHNGLNAIVRLTDARAKRILGRTVPKDGEFEVTWDATRHDQLGDKNDPTSVQGRMISTTLHRKGFETINLILFTTSDLPAQEIIALYGQRQHIETDIRHLKGTLEADFIRAKSAKMVNKELLVRFAAFNLLRCVIAESAKAVGLAPRELSFTLMLGIIRTYTRLFMQTTSLEEQEILWQRYLLRVKATKLPVRKRTRPTYPRKVRRNLRTFPLNRD